MEEVKENGSAGSVDGSEESPSIHEDDTFLDGFPTEIELSEPWVDLTVTDIVDPGHFTVSCFRSDVTITFNAMVSCCGFVISCCGCYNKIPLIQHKAPGPCCSQTFLMKRCGRYMYYMSVFK